MTYEHLTERSIIVRDLPDSSILIAAKFRAFLKDLQEAVPCYDTVGLYFREKVPTLETLGRAMQMPVISPPSVHHRIPVFYEMGEDLIAVARALNLSVSEVIELHTKVEYNCFGVGFVPGFAYLGDLPEELSHLSRLPTPRVSVAAGSVAITGGQTAVYPLETPGGWWIIGRTPLTLVDEDTDYFPISAGDRVKFFAVGEKEFEALKGKRL
jgi:KipI family sensor histidine kinase inhibitor